MVCFQRSVLAAAARQSQRRPQDVSLLLQQPARCFNFGAECCNQNASDIAKAIGKASNVIVMAGAGMSTPSGIPDFRSPGTAFIWRMENVSCKLIHSNTV